MIINDLLKLKKEKKKNAIQLPEHNDLQADLMKLFAETSDLTVIRQCIDSLREPYINESKKCEDCVLFIPYVGSKIREEQNVTHQAAEILHLFGQVRGCLKSKNKNTPCVIQKINDKILFLGRLIWNIDNQKEMTVKWDFPESDDRDLSFYYNPLKHIPKIYSQDMLDLLSSKMDEYEKAVKGSQQAEDNEKTSHTIDELVDILEEDDGAMIPRPATNADISGCNESLIELGLEPLPEGFIHFLKKNNGLAWNGIVFYSTDIVSYADNPSGFKIMDLVSMNDEFNDRYELDEKVLLGIADEDYYTYNIETMKYEILERESREAMEEFESFEDLFFFTVGGRLGLHQEG